MTLQQAILAALNNVTGHALPESALLVDVNVLRPQSRSTLTELRAKLAELERRRLVVGVSPADRDQESKWSITDHGRAEHLQS